MNRNSRTTDPGGAPYRWEHHQEAGRGRVVENELDCCLQDGCKTQADYDVARAEVEALIERAEAGGLGVPNQPGPDPVVTQPALWELRWAFPGGRQLRSYHAEPVAEGELLLGLKFHWKRTAGLSAGEVKAAQNAEINDAAARFARSSHRTDRDEG